MAASPAPPPSPWTQALGDCIAVCIWVVASSTFADVALHLHDLTGVHEGALTVALITGGLALLAPVCSWLWDALINPCGHIALVCVGRMGLGCSLVRMTGQLAGAVLGSAIAIAAVPEQHQRNFHLLPGKLQDGIALEMGFACEAGLLFLSTLVFLYMIGPSKKSTLVTALAAHANTVFVCVVGASFTGPSLNPYLAFSWNLFYRQHSLVEHIVVFWLGPTIGAISAALLWQAIWPSDVTPKRSSKSKAAGKAAAKAIAKQKQMQRQTQKQKQS